MILHTLEQLEQRVQLVLLVLLVLLVPLGQREQLVRLEPLEQLVLRAHHQETNGCLAPLQQCLIQVLIILESMLGTAR